MTTFQRLHPVHSHTHQAQLQQQQHPNSKGSAVLEAQEQQQELAALEEGSAPKQQHMEWDHLLPNPLQQQDQRQLAVLAMLGRHMPTLLQEV
jgi:hypothetical protein